MKIWTAPPVPSMNHAPSGTMAETALPGTPKGHEAAAATQYERLDAANLRNGPELASAQSAPVRLRHN